MEWKISSIAKIPPKLNVAKGSKQNWRKEKQRKKDKVFRKKRGRKGLEKKIKSLMKILQSKKI